MSLALYHEWPGIHERVVEILRGIEPGRYAIIETENWHRAFTRLSGPYDVLFGPTETPMQVFTREWPDLEFVQYSYAEVKLIHWLVPEARVERRCKLPYLSTHCDFSVDNTECTEIIEYEDYETIVLIDRRTGRVVKRDGDASR